MTDGFAALLHLDAAVPADHARAAATALGFDPARTALRRWTDEPTEWGWLVTGRALPDQEPASSASHQVFVAVRSERASTGVVGDDEPVALIVANNVLDRRDAEFDSWYDDVHIPHTFEHFGVLVATRYVALEPAGEHRRLVVYLCGRSIEETRAAMARAAQDRADAEFEGRDPAMPVSETLVAPRQAGFYAPVRG